MSLRAVVVLLLFTGAVQARAEDESKYSLVPAFPNLTFTRPLALVDPGDGSNRFFVVEQAGRILFFDNSPSVRKARTFLDMRNRVTSAENEEGLLGLAFHPEFESNGFFYVNYTAPHPLRTVIARFTVNPAHRDQADPRSELILLEFRQPYSNHNGGSLCFGPDGYLYIGTGDGGSGGDPHRNGQNLDTFLGKILRIDVDHPSAERNYGIPADNPFAGTAHLGEIWAYGLRNPWRFSFDRQTGELWAADVGQDAVEEIDIIRKGGNYGWNIMEGSSCFKPSSGCDSSGLQMPVWEYSHDLGICVIGGLVYRGSRLASLTGKYLCADYGSGRVWAVQADGSGRRASEELVHTNLPITSFAADSANEVYLCVFDGKIYRFR